MEFFSKHLQEKINSYVKLCKPSKLVVCDGSNEEYQKFLKKLVEDKVAFPLKREGCYYFRSDPKDVARVESCTFICTEKKEDAGPTNNWVHPKEMKEKLQGLFSHCMEGRTMYVIPYLMGSLENPMSKVGIELTDSL